MKTKDIDYLIGDFFEKKGFSKISTGTSFSFFKIVKDD